MLNLIDYAGLHVCGVKKVKVLAIQNGGQQNFKISLNVFSMGIKIMTYTNELVHHSISSHPMCAET